MQTVAANGYMIIEAHVINEDNQLSFETNLVLTDYIPIGFRYKMRRFDPMDNPSLFYEFACINPASHEEIVAFANKYGYLGKSVFIVLPKKDFKRKNLKNTFPVAERFGETLLARGEPIGVWRREILDMNRAFELLTLIQKADRERLSQLIFWEDGRVVYKIEGGRSELIASNEPSFSGRTLGLTLKQLQPQSYVQPARSLLLRWINRKLQDNSVFTSLRTTPDFKKVEFGLGSHSLLGVMWYQLARAFTSEGMVSVCVECGRAFQSQRVSARYCSERCKKRAYRARKRS